MNQSIDYNEKAKEFGCKKCCVKLKDVKLLKIHFWKVHISKKDIVNAEKINQFNPIENKDEKNVVTKQKRKLKETDNKTETKKSKTLTNSAKLNEKLENEIVNNHNSSLNESAESQSSCNLSYSDEKINNLDTLSGEDFKYFNLASSIDEADLVKKVESFYFSDKLNFSKIREIMPSRVAWAPWRSYMWPCVINKLSKDARGNFKVHVNYYEANNKKGSIFKFDPSKIELFFRPNIEKHFDYKKIGADYKQRYNFFSCYTDALRDFIKRLEKEENIGLENLKNAEPHEFEKSSSKKKSSSNDTHLINGKQFTLDEVKEYAQKPYSQEQLEVNSERNELSKKLFEKLKSPECKEFLISIVENKIDCKRHKNYLKGDKKVRKEMKFSSPGPLVLEDQQELVRIINDVTMNHYKDKPENLRDYDYDVLYPEAVIWGLRKLDSLTYATAEKKYKQGFKRTEEENLKQKCNELLSKLADEMDKNNDEDKNHTNNGTQFQDLPEELEDLNTSKNNTENQNDKSGDSSIPDLDL